MKILDKSDHYKAVCRDTFYAQNRYLCIDLKSSSEFTNIARIFNLIKRINK